MADLTITRLTAREIARRVGARELSAVAVLEAHLAVIARDNPVLNAICTLAADTALAAAEALDRDLARGARPGPLAGVPVGIKDVVPTAGIRTTYGSPLYADHVPSEDALVVQRLKHAGAIIVGKTNTPEFAAGANTFNAIFGATRNPWNPALSASGSTGGGAAALASGMIALSDGTDLGGSVRTPAAFCCVVGHRPTPGLVPRHPTPQPWDTLNVAGAMARNVGDTALMLQAIAGPSTLSPLAESMKGRDFVAAASAGLPAALRVGYCPDTPRIGVEAEIERACRAAAFSLRQVGASVEEVDLDLSFARKAFLHLRGQWMVNRHFDKLDRLDRLGPNLQANIRLGLAQTPREVAEGEAGRARVFTLFREYFERHDVLLTPTTAVAPFPVEQNYPETIMGQPMASYIEWVAPTFVITLAGGPAMSVPCGLSAARLPIGLQVIGRRGEDETVFAVAGALEATHAIGWPPAQGGAL